ncbi:MAG TPA: zinc-binding dehydrogenase [Thermomicrobiales bacterium]|nr:zinc-binding dehydrogenase [Thermomicrobiales bacterium]
MQTTRVTFSAANVVELETIDLDETDLGPHEVIVRTHRTLISPGTELARLQGKLIFDTDEPPAFPMPIVGYANIGTILATGPEVGVSPGDRVYTMGNHASIVRVDTRQMLCVPVPAGLADEDAVFARLATVSMTTLVTTFARPGHAVAIVGLGLVGNLAAQVFQASGYRVNAFDLSPHRRELAREAGVISVHDGNAMAEFSQQHTLIVEATGSAKALASAVDMAAPGGEIVMIGAPWGGDANSVPSSQITRLLFYRFLRLRSGSEWEIPRQPEPLAIGSNHQNSVTALDWLSTGKLAVQPLITHRITPADVPDAYAGLRDHPNDYLGVVIDWTGGA